MVPRVRVLGGTLEQGPRCCPGGPGPTAMAERRRRDGEECQPTFSYQPSSSTVEGREGRREGEEKNVENKCKIFDCLVSASEVCMEY